MPANSTRTLTQDISCASLVLPLIATSFVTGLLDASTYQIFQTFASNQTGNVILLAVGAAGILDGPHSTLYNGISLAGFLTCGLIFGHAGNHFGPRRRWWLLVNHATQIILIAVALALAWSRALHSSHWVLLLLLATGSGIQVAQARTSGIQELPTAMLSSPMIDFIVDKRFFTLSVHDPQVQARNRRAMGIFAIVSGAFAGAFLHKAKGAELTILVALVCKMAILAALWFVPGDQRDKEKDQEEAAMRKVSSRAIASTR
ncbi:hypothetical protein NliqN6_3924 [Naganishia liquefaciens]|uniref:DUF1275 domain-containing protein n=1 Tax=Naganishia liquefaciens TaxID=104408 RepID=A0A8H3YGS9_9TREE|nr:hypothetical protein NliqN6_3924 [Naganishia liquefaciens]